MAKEKTAYVCSACGYDTLKWVGRCPSCGEWNTLTEVRLGPAPSPAAGRAVQAVAGLVRSMPAPVALRDVPAEAEPRQLFAACMRMSALALMTRGDAMATWWSMPSLSTKDQPVSAELQRKLLDRNVYGNIIYNMLGQQEYIRYINADDATVLKAIEILEKGESFPQAPQPIEEEQTNGKEKVTAQGNGRYQGYLPEIRVAEETLC